MKEWIKKHRNKCLWFLEDHGVGSTDHFSALKIWMFENKFVSLPSHLKTIEPMEVHRGSGTMCNTKTSKVISRTDPMIPLSYTLAVTLDSEKSPLECANEMFESGNFVWSVASKAYPASGASGAD